MKAADNRLSLAASAIMRMREHQWTDYAMDGSGDCGDLIARSHHRAELAALAEHGFTPAEYNALLEERIGGGYVGYRLTSMLAVESDEEFEGHTAVCTLGYPGHPGAEYSTRRYLEGH